MLAIHSQCSHKLIPPKSQSLSGDLVKLPESFGKHKQSSPKVLRGSPPLANAPFAQIPRAVWQLNHLHHLSSTVGAFQ